LGQRSYSGIKSAAEPGEDKISVAHWQHAQHSIGPTDVLSQPDHSSVTMRLRDWGLSGKVDPSQPGWEPTMKSHTSRTGDSQSNKHNPCDLEPPCSTRTAISSNSIAFLPMCCRRFRRFITKSLPTIQQPPSWEKSEVCDDPASANWQEMTWGRHSAHPHQHGGLTKCIRDPVSLSRSSRRCVSSQRASSFHQLSHSIYQQLHHLPFTVAGRRSTLHSVGRFC